MSRRKLAAGNWKMNGLAAQLSEIDALVAACPTPGCDVLICPPATLLAPMAQRAAGSVVAVGGQDCHASESGAHTGDVSAAMLRDAGAAYVILGHSERRADHGESDETVRAKTQAAWAAGLVAIVCVGETESQRDAGEALSVVAGGATPETLVVAYEPVWAIGTGRTPSNDDIAEMHTHMRARLSERFAAEADGMRLLYGGSVKPGNAAEIFALADVDGGLVGGASLKAADFAGIVDAAG